MTTAIAIIPARGGSKRIPRKNIKFFMGKPIIAYSIEAALQSGIFSEVMVSTEDAEIAAVAKEFGAVVPFFRSVETADDHSTTAEVITEVLKVYGKNGKSFDFTCCIYPTAPFITAEKLQRAGTLLQTTGADSVIPVTDFSFPILRSLKMDDFFKISFNWPEYAMTRSQDLPNAYHDCGQFYFIRSELFLNCKNMVSNNTAGMVIPNIEVQDIDNDEDWEIAEMKYQFLQKRGKI